MFYSWQLSINQISHYFSWAVWNLVLTQEIPMRRHCGLYMLIREWKLNLVCLGFFLQLSEGDCIQPMQGAGFPMFPALYHQHVYFMSSAANREMFMQDPMTYLKQPTPKPVVPMRMAILGPPKSGKTTRKHMWQLHNCLTSQHCHQLSTYSSVISNPKASVLWVFQQTFAVRKIFVSSIHQVLWDF